MRRRFVTAASQQRDLGFESRKVGESKAQAKNGIRQIDSGNTPVTPLTAGHNSTMARDSEGAQMGGTYRGTFGPPRIGTRPDQPWTKGEDLHQRRSFRMRHKNRSSTLKEKYAVDRKEPSIKFCWNAKHAAI